MSTIVDEGVLGLSNNGVGNLNLVLTEGLKMIIFEFLADYPVSYVVCVLILHRRILVMI